MNFAIFFVSISCLFSSSSLAVRTGSLHRLPGKHTNLKNALNLEVEKTEDKSHREKRLFSVFNVVRFKNEVCVTASDPTMMGTCFTRNDCQTKGGQADGNCAAGFGVCCMFSVTGCTGDVAHNCTYVQNTGFPTTTAVASETCTYNFNRICPNICQIRLDFNTLVLAADPDPGVCGNAGDTLAVTSPFSAAPVNVNAFPPIICGMNNGQHMYFETGNMGTVAGTLTIVKGTATSGRSWKIKVTYILCDSLLRAPSGCTQYFTGLRGTIKSYNFDGAQLLKNQLYTNCIRQEEGYCQFRVNETPGTTIDAFSLSGPAGVTVTDECNDKSYVIIPTDPTGASTDYRCGEALGNTNGQTVPGSITSSRMTPFTIGVRTNNKAAARFIGKTGFSLDYAQLPC